MTPETAPQFSAVYAEAALAWIETLVPQALLWYEDEGRWDFCPADEELSPELVVFVLQEGWDGQLSLEHSCDPDDERYDSRALRDEIELQMLDEGVARALLEAVRERRERLAEEADEDAGLDSGLMQDEDER